MMHGNGMMEGMPMMGAVGWIFILLLWSFAIDWFPLHDTILVAIHQMGNSG